jgi:hypothetical protein
VRKRKSHSINQNSISQGETIMKQTLFNLSTKAGQMNAQQLRLILAVGSLVLFVLGAGAPAGRGDF